MKRLLVAAIVSIVFATVLAPPVVAQDAPRSDNFDRAKAVSALPFDTTVDVTDATQAEDDPSCRNTGHTVWFKFTPDSDVRLIARVRARKAAEWVSVWTGERGALTEVECGAYRPIFEAAAGTTYYFMVGTYGNRRGGEIRFRLAEAPPPPTIDVAVDPEVTVNSQTEEVTVSGTVTCSSDSQYSEFYGSVRQLDDDRHFITAWFYDYDYECDGTAHSWSVTELGDGVFIDGPGLLQIEAYACSRIECIEEEGVVTNITVQRQ
jgi:hypothetical protein